MVEDHTWCNLCEPEQAYWRLTSNKKATTVHKDPVTHWLQMQNTQKVGGGGPGWIVFEGAYQGEREIPDPEMVHILICTYIG